MAEKDFRVRKGLVVDGTAAATSVAVTTGNVVLTAGTLGLTDGILLSTVSGTPNVSVISSQPTDGNIKIAPNGAGDIVFDTDNLDVSADSMKISIKNNVAAGLDITEAGNSYLKFITTNSSEQIVFGKNSTFASTTIANLGTVSAATSITSTAFVGALDGIIGGTTPAAGSFTSLDVGDGTITNVGDIDADSISIADAAIGLNIDFSGANTTTAKMTLGDNLADALNITESTNSYMKFITTNSSEQIVFGQNSTFASTTIASLGTVSAATSITSTAFVGPIDGVVGGNTPAAGSFTTLGASSTSTLVGTVTIGDGSTNGVIATPAGKYLSLLPGDATGTDTNGGRVVIQGGAGTGTGAGGYVKFELAPPAAGTGSGSNAHVEALTLQATVNGANPTATFTGVTTAPTFATSNTTTGITVSGSTISTDGSQTNIHLTLDPQGSGEIDAQAALDMNDLNIKHVDTMFIKHIDANQVGGTGTTDVIHIGRTDNVVIGGTALADNNIALQVNGGANAALHSNTGAGSSGGDADYTEVRLHIGVTESEMADLTHPKELVALVLQNSNSGTNSHQGSKGIIFDVPTGTPGGDAAGSTWGIGTTQDDMKRFVIGFAGSKQGWDNSTKGTTNSPLNDLRAADSQPLYVMDEGGNHYVQIGTHIGGAAAAGTFNFIEGNSSATAPKTKIQITGEGAIRFYETGESEDNYIAIQAPADLTGTGNYTLTLPVDDGANGEVLQTNGSGVLSWSAAASGGIALTDLSVGTEATAAGDGGISYASGTGVFTYTPPLIGVTALNNATANELVTVGATTTQLDAEADLTFDGTIFTVGSATDADHQLRLHTMLNGDAALKVSHVSDATDAIAFTTESIEATLTSNSTGNDGAHQQFVGLKSDVNVAQNHASGTKTATGLLVDVDGVTTGTTTGYGLDVSVDSFDDNYAAVFRSGSVGIGALPDTSTLLEITTSDTAGEALFLTSTHSSAGGNTIGPVLRFNAKRVGSEAGVNNDDLGSLEWYGQDSAGNNQAFGFIKTRVTSIATGSETGSLQFAVATSTSGGIENVMSINGGVSAATSTVQIHGHLQVDGTTTTINSTELIVDDKNITIASGAADSAAADGAGITVDGAAASITYTDTGTKWNMNKPLSVTGAVTASTSFVIGSADLNETDLEKLDGITNGTVAANKAVVVDGNKDIGDFRNLTAVAVITDTVKTDYSHIVSTQVASGTIAVAGTATIATIDSTVYRGAEILTTVYNDTDNTTDLFKTVVMWDGHDTSLDNVGAACHYTNYAVLSSGDVASGDISAVKSSANILVKFTATGGSNAGNDTYIIRSQQTLLVI
mgnify:CR=1 FL=1|tara:strand:+ start:10901 stop:14878 length:3978 start_codon:yes stop_codon:yes gene_type:complete